MKKINLSWNGFGLEGAIGLQDALKGNSVLEELDVSYVISVLVNCAYECDTKCFGTYVTNHKMYCKELYNPK